MRTVSFVLIFKVFSAAFILICVPRCIRWQERRRKEKIYNYSSFTVTCFNILDSFIFTHNTKLYLIVYVAHLTCFVTITFLLKITF